MGKTVCGRSLRFSGSFPHAYKMTAAAPLITYTVKQETQQNISQKSFQQFLTTQNCGLAQLDNCIAK